MNILACNLDAVGRIAILSHIQTNESWENAWKYLKAESKRTSGQVIK